MCTLCSAYPPPLWPVFLSCAFDASPFWPPPYSVDRTSSEPFAGLIVPPAPRCSLDPGLGPPYLSCLLSPSIIFSRFLVLNITYVLMSDRFLFLAGFPFLKFRLICSIGISTPSLVIFKTELLIFASRLAHLISLPISAFPW